MRNLIYSLYEKRLSSTILGAEARNDLPKHVAVMLDGNRRWAKVRQLSKAADGHAAELEIRDGTRGYGLQIARIRIDQPVRGGGE